MATIFSHAICAVALGAAFTVATDRPRKDKIPARFWSLSAICAALPDADVIGFALGIRYADALGHRGFSHSILFALLTGWLVAWLFFAGLAPRISRVALSGYFFLITISHGCLDALTDGGLGVAFFAPLDQTRYFFPWRPIEVSPIGADFFSARGLEVIVSELLWIWIPALMIIVCALCSAWLMKQSGSGRN
jgi:inner membrane protein